MSRNSSIINFHARGTPELKENEVNLQRHLLAKFRFFFCGLLEKLVLIIFELYRLKMNGLSEIKLQRLMSDGIQE